MFTVVHCCTEHCTTDSSETAAEIYSQHALALNIPLNKDLNHRFFEIMSAGVPQIILGSKALLGENQNLAKRDDIYWASSIEEIENTAKTLFENHDYLESIKIAPPPYIPIKQLLKKSFAFI